MSSFATVVRAPALRSARLTGVTAVVAALAAAVNAGAVSRFGWRQPMELLCGVAITFDLLAMAVVLGAVAVVLIRRRSPAPVPAVPLVVDQQGRELGAPPRASLMATLGLVLVVMVWVLWLVLSGSPILFASLGSSRVGYADAVGGAVLFGAPWILGTVFAAAGLHRGGDRRNLVLAVLGVVLGLGLGVLLVALSVARAFGALD